MIASVLKFEFRRMISSPSSWVIFAAVQFLLALIFYNLLFKYLTDPALFEGRGITDVVIASYYRSVALIFLLIAPLLTMRLISEEINSGSIKLLLSSPISAHQIILGKFFAATGFLLFLLILISLIPFSLSIGTSLDYGHLLACIVGSSLLLISLCSAGLFFSSLFSHQIVSAITSYAAILLLWTAHTAASSEGSNIDRLFQSLSMSIHFTSFTEGVLNSASVSFFIIITLLFLIMGIWNVKTMRTMEWQ
jgi:ABC-2 type transport system permease protein